MYSVINQVKLHNGEGWIVNPFNESSGYVISSYNIQSDTWSGANIHDSFLNEDLHLYVPQEIAFDNSGQLWVGFDYRTSYSDGGVRYLNSNGQFTEVFNDGILVGGDNSDVWSIDICSYNGFDILWVLSSNGVGGYTILNNNIRMVSWICNIK